MRRTILLGASALLIGLLVNSQAEAWRGYRGGGWGGGFRGTAIGPGGTGWAARGMAGPRFASGWGAGRWAAVRPGLGYGYRYPLYGAGVAAAAYYGSSYPSYGYEANPYGYEPAAYSYEPASYSYDPYTWGGYGYSDDCVVVRRLVFDGHSYRVVRADPCYRY